MGLLSEGSPLSWEETKKYADHVRQHGIQQFLNQYRKLRSRTKDVLYWGDEVEYQVVKFDHANRRVQLSLRNQEILKKLNEITGNSPSETRSAWHPEYAAYMVEGTPGKPYGGLMAHFNLVEANMRRRRKEIERVLQEDEAPLSLTVFPRLGVGEFTTPPCQPNPESGASKSIFFPDEAINNGHPRFKTLTRNIRERRKEKVCINVPVYKDVNTPSPFVEDFSGLRDVGGEAQRSALPDHVYMDCMGFGMGCCCLQVTFQACNISEARLLYDQLAPFCPIMLALTAASPIYRGHLSDIDTRWTVIAQSVDDRTKEERGLEPLKDNRFQISKSRYDSIDSYLSECSTCYNDIELTMDTDIYDTLIAGGVDNMLARHLAHLFIRDPISLFSEKLQQNNEEDTDHFENIQSTNWQTMRFKPPPPQSNIGWRVEFRPMEAQLTDFENAAYTVFIVLLTRVILSYKLNFIIPISKVDENMKTAFKRDGVLEGKFYFRKDVLTDCSPPEACECSSSCRLQCCSGVEDEYRLMTVDEIINGSDDFVGILPQINTYLNNIECDVETRCTVQQYLHLISKRASGELKTTARWIRDLVAAHPEYKQDSMISEGITYDLLMKFAKVSREEVEEPELVFGHQTLTKDTIPNAVRTAEQLLDKKNPHPTCTTDSTSSTTKGAC
ncbi:glutamate--cysteine ligase catalytic subunit-like [Babylonia areolata]|uniref:glutamate--cysteine ligase catalytic subunit-like n=1 Tax=Babylonia areolata TaxID=304850 RepID=UPI003FD1CA1E